MQDMFKDDITKSIAKTVSDVLEGKVKKEEMDPTDHVKNKDGQFVVVAPGGKVVKAFGKKAEADAYAIKNHDAIMKAGEKKESPEEPKPAGEKEFKAKHKVKKSGEKEDGTVMKEEAEEVSEKKISEKSKLNGYLDENPDDLDEDQKAYQAFFKKAMKKFGVESPADFKDDEKKKEFFDYIAVSYTHLTLPTTD